MDEWGSPRHTEVVRCAFRVHREGRPADVWCVVCGVHCGGTRQPPTASVLAHLRLPACSSVHAWLIRLRTGSDFAPARLPVPDHVVHDSAPVHRGVVANASLGLA